METEQSLYWDLVRKSCGKLHRAVCDLIGVVHYVGLVLYFGHYLCFYLYFTLAASSDYRYLFYAYTAWLVLDFRTPNRGGRPLRFCRMLFPWRCIQQYFPLRLRKTADLPPERNYLFVCHPHGIIAIGAAANFATNVTGFTETFPGVRTVLAASKYLFGIPFYRDIMLVNGVIAATKEGMESVLSRPASSDESRSVALVLGGARELLDARPGSTTVVVRERKAFAKIALTTGADIVPVFTFGENELYSQFEFSYIKRFLVWIDSWSMFALPLPTSFFPRKRPLDTVVGAPIKVTQRPIPTQKEIDDLHQRYMDDLNALFDRHKARYGYNPNQCLNFI